MTPLAAAATAPLPTALQRAWRRARLRAAVRPMLAGLPVLAGIFVLALRLISPAAAATLSCVLLACVIGVALNRWRRYDRAWLARRLNALDLSFEDSVELVLLPKSRLSDLERLQQQRLRERLQRPTWPALQTPTSRSHFVLAWSLASALILLAYGIPALSRAVQRIETSSDKRVGGIEATLSVHPPAYTGLPQQTLRTLDARAAAGSELQWMLRLDDATTSVALVFDDGSRLSLQRDGAAWRGRRVLAASSLYRLERDGQLAQEPLYRLDAIADRPPQITVRTPDKTLNLLGDGQKSWDLAFEATDDYGLAAAELSVSLAQGSGDNVKTTEHRQTLDGSGGARARSYRQTLDLSALGFVKGDDLIVRLTVSDNREPAANRTQSASFILRWPAEADRESTGLDAIVQKVLPAYFRSERQLIIDTEALQAQRGTLDDARFGKTADGLGVDQKVLRLRYGQFLGEEFESNAEQAPPGVAEAAGKNAANKDSVAHDSLKNIPAEPGAGANVSAPAAAGFGEAGNVVAENGHMHDQPEAATLLDPDTRRILKSALDEMWQAELQLRQAQPEAALPFEYKALDYIKQVQQAERIYLARAGVELPQVDMARRLTGERKGLDDRELKLNAAAPDDSPLPAAWRALQGGDAPDWDALEAWLRTHPAGSPEQFDALGAIAAAEKLRAEPQCSACATDLKARLWPLLPAPPTAVLPRAQATATGNAYLDALSSATAEPAP